MTTNILSNSDLLEGKPRQSAVLKTLVDGINQIIQDKLITPVDGDGGIEEQSSILTATGIWLDHIGSKLKYPRPIIVDPSAGVWFGFDGNGLGFDQITFVPGVDSSGIADEPYRALLIIRGSQLLTDCSIPSLNATIQGAFGSGNYIDNGNMTLDVTLDDSQSDVMIAALIDSGLITKPAGVLINNILISHTAGNFGFDGNGEGFDQALFVRTPSDLIV